jgi:predicted O-methyltransferase YrrM
LTKDNASYLAELCALVLNTDSNSIESYFAELQNDEGLKQHILLATKWSGFGYNASTNIQYGRRLAWYAAVRVLRPRLVVETGVDKGLGSVVLCAALLRNKEEGYIGRYIGTDINPSAGFMLQGEYADMGSVIYGNSIDCLRKIESPIDLFINDSDHSSEYERNEYYTILPNIHQETLVLGDNAHCTTELLRFAREQGLSFAFFQEKPDNHWYPGAGIGFAWRAN